MGRSIEYWWFAHNKMPFVSSSFTGKDVMNENNLFSSCILNVTTQNPNPEPVKYLKGKTSQQMACNRKGCLCWVVSQAFYRFVDNFHGLGCDHCRINQLINILKTKWEWLCLCREKWQVCDQIKAPIKSWHWALSAKVCAVELLSPHALQHALPPRPPSFPPAVGQWHHVNNFTSSNSNCL